MRISQIILAVTLLLGTSFAQQRMVSIPEDQLTEQQKSTLKNSGALQTTHEWVGIGKEVGEAVNTSLGAITEQANNFSKTGVGRITVALVVWKVLGNDAVHFLAAIIELTLFVPVFLWSYRRTCMTRRVVVSSEGWFLNRKQTWQVVAYDKGNSYDGPTVRGWHCIALSIFTIIWLVTVFSA